MIYLLNLIIENKHDIFLWIITIFSLCMALCILYAILLACYETSFLPLVIIIYARILYSVHKKTDL